MKKHTQYRSRVVSLLLCAALFLCLFPLPVFGETTAQTDPEIAFLTIREGDIVTRCTFGDGTVVEPDSPVTAEIDCPIAGEYRVALVFRQEDYSTLGNHGTLTVNDRTVYFNLSGVWYDEETTRSVDRDGNEVIGLSAFSTDKIVQYLCQETEYSSLDSSYVFNSGLNTVTLSVQETALTAYELLVVRLPGYGGLAASPIQNGKQILIEAEDYALKSDSYIHADNVQNADVTPYTADMKKINVLSGGVFNTHRQKVLYTFHVETAGDYQLAVRFNQDSKKGMSVYRHFEIDGVTPAACFDNVSFPYTGLDYVTQTVADNGRGAWIHLEPGWHTVAMTATAAPIAACHQRLSALLDEITDAGIAVRMITGGKTDKNRTWDIEKYLPTIVDDLNRWADEMEEIYDELAVMAGQKPSFAIALHKSTQYLRTAAASPRTLPSKTTRIFEGSGSVTQMVGDLLTQLLQQQLTVDKLYLFSADEPVESYPGFFKRLFNGIRQFLRSFHADYNSYGNVKTSEQVLDVWVKRPLMAVETLQMMTDAEFTAETGIPVKVTIMPNEEKIVLANAARQTPDVAMGMTLGRPYELGLRDAVVDLYDFDDFLSFYGENYDLNLLVPMWVNGRMCGVVESRTFQVLYYRTDIFGQLGLTVPDTWEDVKLMMPELKRNGMNFHVALASHSGTKPLSTTAYYFQQNGASLYAENGLSTVINDEKGQESFQLLTDLFNIYSLPVSTENFFNSFRYGSVPIGISNLDTYIRLKNAAPEIAGQWDIALTPGIKDENGVVHRDQTSASETAVIMKQTNMKDEAWRFLKWWLSTDVQEEYAVIMKTKFGPTYIWNTANMTAFRTLDIEKRHLDVIFEQWRWSYEVPLHPASYMLERELSNAWNNVVVKKKETRSSLDKAVLTVNREIERKLEEFGFVKNGTLVKPCLLATPERIKEGRTDEKSDR